MDFHELDVFINLHKKDAAVLPLCIRSVFRYLVPRPNRVTIVSNELPSSLLGEIGRYKIGFMNESSVIDELRRSDMPQIVYEGENRAGWYYQQFLKWGVRKYSKTDSYVTVDADVVFIRPIILVRHNKYVFHRRDEYHVPYFKTYEKLFSYFPERDKSYIANYMVFDVSIIDEIIARIEKLCVGKKWYEIVLDTIDKTELSSFSEFETYGHYMSRFYPYLFESCDCRNLVLPKERIPLHRIDRVIAKLKGFNSVVYHNYDRRE